MELVLLVYNTSTAAKAYAFANLIARVHIGTMARYIRAGMVKKHCQGSC